MLFKATTELILIICGLVIQHWSCTAVCFHTMLNFVQSFIKFAYVISHKLLHWSSACLSRTSFTNAENSIR